MHIKICILLWFLVNPTECVKQKQKNVLMIIADDLRPELDCQPLPGTTRSQMHTPHICELARESLQFMHNHAPMAHCSPSRTATFTGRGVGTTHIWDLTSYWRNVTGNFTTIPQFFKNKGYRTTAIGKIFHQGSASGQSKWTDECPQCSPWNMQDSRYSWSDKVFYARDIEHEVSTERSWKSVRKGAPLRDTQITMRAVKTIQERGAEKEKNPFFIAVGFYKPHLPFTVPERFYGYYNPDDIKLPLNPYAPDNLLKSGWGWSKELLQYQDIKDAWEFNSTLPDYKTLELRRGYYAAVSYTDYNVGSILSALRDAGLEEDTIVVFWGDHGWSLGEHGRWDKHTNFDTDTHCPLMIKVPGLTDGGNKTEELTGLIDIFPTLVELVFGKEVLESELPLCPEDSSDVETCREGVSLVPLLQDPDMRIRDAVYSAFGIGVINNNRGHGQPSRCLYDSCRMVYSVQTRVNRIVFRYAEAVMYENMSPRWDLLLGRELYNHYDDPGENYNIIDSSSAFLIRRLRIRLHKGSLWSGTPP